jgi:RNA polymerase sigma factor (TIGR02999 family)
MAQEEGVTELLQAWRNGDSNAFDALVPLVYRELHKLAEWQMSGENVSHTLSPTALLHESFLKMMQSGSSPDWQNRKHFFVVASKAMRQLLVDHARRKRAGKRDSGNMPAGSGVHVAGAPWDVIDLDRALATLHGQEPRRARMLELRYFGGLDLREIADVMDLSTATVSRELRVTEAWLAREIRVWIGRASSNCSMRRVLCHAARRMLFLIASAAMTRSCAAPLATCWRNRLAAHPDSCADSLHRTLQASSKAP